MSIGTQALQSYEVKKGTIANISIDGRGFLDAGESYSGVPTFTASPSGLTFSNESVSIQVLTINGQNVPIGKAIQCSVDTTAATVAEYTITASADTDSTPPQTRLVDLILEVVD